MRILGIESSCDETAAAVSENGRTILSSVVATQIAEHAKYGGVVPEIASRRHSEAILAVTQRALNEAHLSLQEVDAIAVTCAPGLIGALLVGVSFAKGLALALQKPLIPVHHISGHIAANYIAHPDLKPPYLCLIASGGHSMLVLAESYTSWRVLGRSRDDAAGECFDKCARALGYPYPGGVQIDRAAEKGNPRAIRLPHPKLEGCPYDFSFSGLKTAVVNGIHNAQQRGETLCPEDYAASLQETIAALLTEKTVLAARELGIQTVAAAGGVSANSGVRAALQSACDQNGWKLYLPPLSLCGDNGAMIACQAYYNYQAGILADESLNAAATWQLDQFSSAFSPGA